MTKEERAKYKRRLRANFTPLVAKDIETLISTRDGLTEIDTEFDTPARLGKLMIYFGVLTRALCEAKGLETYPISSFKTAFFKVSEYNRIIAIEDESKAIEQTILYAVQVLNEIIGNN